MSSEADLVLAAARDRAAALAAGDRDRLTELLHPDLVWTSHRGDRYSRSGYLEANCGGELRWLGQDVRDPKVVVVGGTAVLTATVVDDIDRGAGPARFTMPLTQTWVRADGRWQLLAGHAGPRLDG